MNSRNNAQMKTCAFNKSKVIIAGLIAKDFDTESRFLSYDKEYGIYPVLAKVLYSSLTPAEILEEFPEIKGDRVPAFAGELLERIKYSSDLLSSINADYDGSLFSLFQKSAIRLIQDKVRALKSRKTHKEENDNMAGEDERRKFEARDLLNHIIADAKQLNDFQKFIIEHWKREYEPKEIVKAYSILKNKTYTMNYYYAQASLAMKYLKAASKSYKWS